MASALKKAHCVSPGFGLYFLCGLFYFDKRLFFVFAFEKVFKLYKKVLSLGFVQVLQADVYGSERYVFYNVHVVEEVKALEHHAHFAALDIYVNLEVAQIVAFEKDVPVGGVLQNVQAP